MWRIWAGSVPREQFGTCVFWKADRDRDRDGKEEVPVTDNVILTKLWINLVVIISLKTVRSFKRR